MLTQIAGIVPVSGRELDFNMPWHDSLMPIAPNYLAVERAVAECAYAGCSTIWLVCSDDVQPLIRYQLGEKIEDPVYSYRSFEHSKKDFKRFIRIYYLPIDIRDINKRDCLSWSVIYGVLSANKIIKSISGWLVPKRFYIAWPYGCYQPYVVREHRKDIANRNFMLSHEEETIQDDKYLGFNITLEQASQLRLEVRQKSTGLWVDHKVRDERLSLEERFSYRNFKPSQVFDTLDTSEYKIASIEDYHNISNWKNYCEFLSKDLGLKKPSILGFAEWNEIGKDD